MIFSQKNLVAVFSRRDQGNMSLDYGDTGSSLDNREIFLRNLDVDFRDLVCCRQVHGSRVRLVEEPGAVLADTDALISVKRNIPLAIFTADCLSVFLYDSVNQAIGLAHAGWKGTKDKILFSTIRLMQQQFNTNIADLEVGFGPCIRQCCYQVEEEFKNYFDFGLSKRTDGLYLDLAAINRKELLDLGIKENNITDSGICTVCQNKDFFSFRKEAKAAGRMISVIMLK